MQIMTTRFLRSKRDSAGLVPRVERDVALSALSSNSPLGLLREDSWPSRVPLPQSLGPLGPLGLLGCYATILGHHEYPAKWRVSDRV